MNQPLVKTLCASLLVAAATMGVVPLQHVRSMDVETTESKKGPSSISLSVNASGQVVFDDKVITFGVLEELLEERLATDKDLPVIISSAPTTHYDALLAVHAVVRGCGVTNVHFRKLLVTEAAPAVNESTRQLKVIHLQHLRSSDLLRTLKQLELIGKNLSAAAPKAKLLVLRGDPSLIEEAICVAELLDAPPQTDNVGKAQAGEATAPMESRTVAAVADKQTEVEGVLLELNQPGAITVVVSLGSDDGVTSGDILTVLRKGKRVGSLKLAKVERDRSTAAIMGLDDVKALEKGDQVTNRKPPGGPPAARPPQKDSDAQRKEEAPTGTLSGRFVYGGKPPVAEDLFPGFAEIDVAKPQERGLDGRFSGVEAVYREYLEHSIRPPTIDQSLRVGKDKGLADVVLWVVSDDIPWTPSPENQMPVTIQVKNASFSPPATAVIAGQSVIIENRDLVDQSVSAMFSRALSPPFNVLLKASSTESSAKMVFPVPEPFPARISLQHCPWASGLLFVHSNPYVAISQEDGSFRIPNLPLGQWEFQAWHPRSGYITDWPHLRGPRKPGRFTQRIMAGDNRLAAIEFSPELFKVRAGVDKTLLLGQWKVIAQASRGEPVDRFNYDGMQWKLGKETLDILPATINRAGAAEKPLPKSSYTVDNTQSPAHFNWTFGEGKTSVEIAGIYELKDDVLRICVSQHGEARPTGFETKGQKWTVYEFKRVLGD